MNGGQCSVCLEHSDDVTCQDCLPDASAEVVRLKCEMSDAVTAVQRHYAENLEREREKVRDEYAGLLAAARRLVAPRVMGPSALDMKALRIEVEKLTPQMKGEDT